MTVTKRLENLGWPSYWTQFTQSAFKFAEDSRGSYVLFVEKNIIPVYTLEDAVLSLRNEENSLENLLFSNEIRQEHWSSLLKFAKNSKRFQ